MGSEWILGRLAWGCGLDSTGSGHGPVAGCCECGDEPSGSCATELVSYGERRWNDIGKGKRKNSEKNLSQCHFVHKSHMDWPRREPGTLRLQAGDNRLSYSTARPVCGHILYWLSYTSSRVLRHTVSHCTDLPRGYGWETFVSPAVRSRNNLNIGQTHFLSNSSQLVMCHTA
jgi:hypothetical protein